MKRDEMIDLRKRLVRGDPPYTVDQMGNLIREKGGLAGLDERRALGDHDPNASGVRLALETQLALIDHLLERMR